MPKTYRIDIQLDIRDVDGKARQLDQGAQAIERSYKRAGDAADQVAGRAQKSADALTAAEDRAAQQKQAIWDRWSKKAYDHDVAAARRKEETAQKLAQQADRLRERDSARAEKQAENSANVETRAAQRAADDKQAIWDRWSKKAYDQDVAAARRREQQAARATQQAEKDAQHQAQSQTNWLYRLEQERERAAQRRASQEARLSQGHMAQEAIEFQATQRYVEQTNEKRIAAAVRVKEIENGGWAASLGSMKSMLGLTGGIVAGVMAMAGAARSYADAMREAAESSKRMGEKFATDRRKLTELASIQGKPLNDDFVLQFANFGMQTGLTKDENLKLQEQFYNSGQQFIGDKGNISEKEAGQYKKLVAQLAGARGIDPAIVGDLAGKMLGFENYQKKYGNAAAEVAASRLNQSLAILSSGSGKNATNARQMTMLMGSTLNEDEMKNAFSDPAQVAIANSIAAERNPEEADTIVRATVRGLSAGNKKAAPLLKKAKIGPEDRDFFEKIRMIKPVIDEEMTRTHKSLRDVLPTYFPDVRMQEGIATFLEQGVSKDLIGKRQKTAAENQGFTPFAKVVTDFEKTPEGAQRIADAKLEYAEASRGKQVSGLNVLRKEALASLTAYGRIDDPQRIFIAKILADKGAGFLAPDQRMMIDHEAIKLLNARTPDRIGDLNADRLVAGSPRRMEAEVNRVLSEMNAAGLSGLKDPINKLNRNIEEMNELLRQQQKQPPQQPRERQMIPPPPGGARRAP